MWTTQDEENFKKFFGETPVPSPRNAAKPPPVIYLPMKEYSTPDNATNNTHQDTRNA